MALHCDKKHPAAEGLFLTFALPVGIDCAGVGENYKKHM
jgi:hypothetical protein